MSDSTKSFGRRTSGILLHVTSLPGRHGSGDLSADADRFVDFLAAAGQSWWQTLPVGPIGGPPANSPYDSPSSLAGNPYLIAVDELVALGLLDKREAAPPAGVRADRVHFPAVRRHREQLLARAYEQFGGGGAAKLRGEFDAFVAAEADWLDDFALFQAARQRTGRPWWEWDDGLRRLKPAAMESARRDLAEAIGYHRFVQFLFFRQWRRLRRYASDRGVGLIGDVPIFVSHDSVDVWRHQHLFQLDRAGRAKAVTGVPPDLFSATGQRWGHPQYDWRAHAKDGFRWWVDRFRGTFRLFDAVRIDHFLGFARVWSIPAASPTAAAGKWVQSPGRELFAAVEAALGRLPFIAEDLGILTPQAAALRDGLGFPGMRVLQFGFGGDDAYHRPHDFPRNSVVYTGTHDNDTTAGWFRKLGRTSAERRRVLAYLGTDGKDVAMDLIRAALRSVANTAIFPLQDALGLDAKARMNTPGTTAGNWQWRVDGRLTTKDVAAELREVAEVTGRVARP